MWRQEDCCPTPQYIFTAFIKWPWPLNFSSVCSTPMQWWHPLEEYIRRYCGLVDHVDGSTISAIPLVCKWHCHTRSQHLLTDFTVFMTSICHHQELQGIAPAVATELAYAHWKEWVFACSLKGWVRKNRPVSFSSLKSVFPNNLFSSYSDWLV